MFEAYKKYLLKKAIYETDEYGMIVASVPGYESYFTQGETVEEARECLLEVIEDVLLLKLEQGDTRLLEELKFFTLQEPSYA